MQGVIVAPNGDVWAADTLKSQIVRFPKGDPSKGELLYQNASGDPLANPCKIVLPFALAVDQKGDIWVTNILADHVTRFPGGDVGKPEIFGAGFPGRRPRRRQSRQRVDHQQVRQFRARPR